jgi:hypothetical protein
MNPNPRNDSLMAKRGLPGGFHTLISAAFVG